MVTIDGGHIALSLAEIEAFDPSPRMSAGRARFACLLCRSAGRHLAVDEQTGRWRCWRCQAYGIVRERWADRGETTRLKLAAAFGDAAQSAGAARRTAELRRATPEPSRPVDDRWWRRHWDAGRDLAGTPGADYLARRGIPLHVAERHGVRYGRRFLQDRACVLFPCTDQAGHQVVAVNARYLDGSTTANKTQTAGPRSSGAFWAAGALARDPIVVVEGPMDTLSLAVAGIPSLALVGTSGTSWLPDVCRGRQVALALDNDHGGEDGSLRLARLIAQEGGRPGRLRPILNDWNDELLANGPDALALRFGRPLVERCVWSGCAEPAGNGFTCRHHLRGAAEAAAEVLAGGES